MAPLYHPLPNSGMVREIIAACAWSPDPYLFFSGNVFSNLVYYAHIIPIVLGIGFGIYAFLRNRKNPLTKIYLFIAGTIVLWMGLDLIVWASDNVERILFSWTVVSMVEPMVHAGVAYLVIVAAQGSRLSIGKKWLLVLPLIPIIIFIPTHWYISGFSLATCDRDVVEGIFAVYLYATEILYIVVTTVVGVRAMMQLPTSETKNKVMYIFFTSIFLLVAFSAGNIAGSISDDWKYTQYGFFAVPVALGLLSFGIVQKRFSIQSQLMRAQLTIVGIWLVVASLLFIDSVTQVRVVVSGILIALLGLGYLLVRGFGDEIRRREEIEELNEILIEANHKQMVLVHLTTHQIKGFLTKTRNIFSMIRDEDLGPLPAYLEPLIDEGLSSDQKGITTVQNILNAFAIKSGKAMYTLKELDLKELVEVLMMEFERTAEEKKIFLSLSTDTDDVSAFHIMADRFPLQSALRNVFENALKYTPQGSIHVTLHANKQEVRMTVTDTGIGISAEDKALLFTEGGHGRNSRLVNVESTGYGLYVVKNIVEAHGGTVSASSAGVGKGSTFTVTLPVIKK